MEILKYKYKLLKVVLKWERPVAPLHRTSPSPVRRVHDKFSSVCVIPLGKKSSSLSLSLSLYVSHPSAPTKHSSAQPSEQIVSVEQ